MGRGIGIGEALVVMEQNRVRVDRIVGIDGASMFVVGRRRIV